KGPADPELFADGATSELEQSLHEATRQLALGDAEGATKVATEIDAKATLLKKLYLDTTKSFDATEAQMSYLRGEGVLTNALEALGRAIEEARKRAQFLRGSGLTFLPDIQEVLTRAELEFHQGNFVGSSEDLRIATVLLDQVTRAPNGKN